MIALLVWSLRASAVVAFAGVLLLIFRNRSAAQRNVVVRIAVAVAWILPLASFVAPRIEVPSPEAFVRAYQPAPPTPNFVPNPVTQSKTGGFNPTAAVSTAAVTPAAEPRSFPWAALYSVGVAALALRWLIGVIGLLRLRRAAIPTGEPHVFRAAIPVPATYGRTILVPEVSTEWPESRLQAAILHERAHVGRRDWLWQTFAGGLAAAHWFNPFVWVLVRLLRDTAEASADDAALAAGVAPSVYARELMAVASLVGSTGPALAMARRGGVKDRVKAVLAVSRDRRAPSRRASALLITVLAASGLAVAGLAQKAEAKKRAAIRLVDVRQVFPYPSSRWDAERRPVETPADEVKEENGYGQRNMRRLKARFAIDHPVESEQFRVYVDSPAKMAHVELPRGNGQPSKGSNDGSLKLQFDAPLAATQARIRVGRASGLYKLYAGPNVAFKATTESLTWPDGTYSGAKISFIFPRALKEKDYRVFVVTDKGRVDVKDNDYEYSDDADEVPTAVSVPVDSPSNVRKIGIEFREFAMTPVVVPLNPQDLRIVAPPAAAKHSIQFLGFYDDTRAWLPDGTPSKGFGSPTQYLGSTNSLMPSPGMRHLTAAFRIKGKTYVEPWMRMMYADGKGGKTVSDGYAFSPVEGKPDERIAFLTFHVAPEVEITDLEVDFGANPWPVYVDTTPGSGPGQAEVRKLKSVKERGEAWTYYQVSINGTSPIDLRRNNELSLLTAEGGWLGMSLPVLPTPADPTFKTYVKDPAKIGRVIFRSREPEHAKFTNVHLTPNP